MCYDLRFPELFRTIVDDCRLILVIASWPATRQAHWDILLRARAVECQCFVVGVNRVGLGGGLAFTGGSAVIDRMAVGCAAEGWTISIGSGPGRANSKINVEFVGSGKLVEPSAVLLPAATVEKLLPSASLSLTISGTDYVTSKNIVSLETGWKNNLRMDAGFYPGSGFQSAGDGASGAIRGRLEFGSRQGTLKFVARFESTSTELTKLKSQTTGTAGGGAPCPSTNTGAGSASRSSSGSRG